MKLNLSLYLKSVLVIPFFLISNFANADEISPSQEQVKSFQFSLELANKFPLILSLNPRFIFSENYEVALLYGKTPPSYSNSIASYVSSSSGNSSYEKVIQAAFQNNYLWGLGFQYNFNSAKSGWTTELNYFQLNSTGQAEIDDVLYAATGYNYTTLKNLLIAAGKSTAVDMTSKLNILEINVGYTFEITSQFNIRTKLGFAQVTQANIDLKTGLTNFENTTYGSNLMSTTENDMASIIKDNGMSPTLSLNLNYIF